MTNSKYQFKDKNNLSYYPIKNDFINHCQSKFKIYSDGLDKIDRNFTGQYKELYLEKRGKYKESFEQYFSYDDGVSWFEIKEWKNHRQIIQDLKRTDTFKKNQENSNISTNTNKSNSNNSFIYIILIIAVGVFFFVKRQENKSSSQTNTINSSTNTDAVGQSAEDSKSSDPQIESSASEEQVDNSVPEPQNNEDNGYDNNSQSNESSSSNTYQQENNQPVKRKCNRCNGTGDCPKCSKVFTTHYWGGKYSGWKNGNETRPGQVMCNDCRGAGVIYGRQTMGEDPESKKCYVSSCRNGWQHCSECNSYGNGRNLGKCGECKGTGFQR